MSVRLVLLGPPGSGKGTLATKLGEVLAVPHISTGEIFRQEIGRQSALGRSVHAYVSSGRLVPDAASPRAGCLVLMSTTLPEEVEGRHGHRNALARSRRRKRRAERSCC